MPFRGFERCTPEAVGVRSDAVMRLLDRLEYGGFTEMHGLMIMRHGKVCAEGWWAPCAPGLRHALFSLSKTWTATAIGLLEYEGRLRVTDPVAALLPDKMPPVLTDELKKLTVRDLLTMSGGSDTELPDYPADWLRDFFARPIEHEPGTHWRYNSHGTTVLSAIVERLSGQSMLDFLKEKLFPVIGVDGDNVLCRRAGDGTCLGGHGMFTTTEDNLRLMLLYLNGGVWEGKRLLSERFARDAVSPLLDNAPAHADAPWIHDNRVGYGYQIWMCRPEGSYRADGAFGQFVVVVPGLDLIVSINEAAYIGRNVSHTALSEKLMDRGFPDHPIHGPQQTLNALFEELLPGITQDGAALPESPDALSLARRMARLSLPRPWPASRPVRPIAVTLVPLKGRISFRMLQSLGGRDPLEPQADRIRLETRDGLLYVDFDEAGKRSRLIADMTGGGMTGVLDPAGTGDVVSRVLCFARADRDTLTLSVRWYETENHNKFTFTFGDGRVLIRKWTEAGIPDPLTECEAVYQIVKE